MLSLIISRTGYGKTTFIKNKIKELADAEKAVILIVPEQISFESERDILRAVGAKKLQNVSVMSFTRLCSEFFAVYGGREKPYIDTVGKTALMEETLKKLSPALELFKKSAESPKFCELMIDLDGKIKKSAVNADDLIQCSKEVTGILKQKLNEAALILSEYGELLNKDYFDPAKDIDIVSQKIGETEFFKGKTIFVDSFTGFTNQQLKIIEAIIKFSENSFISLGFDGIYSENKLSVFSNTAKTALQLKQIAKDNFVEIGEDIVLTGVSRYKNDELDFLEKNLFSNENNIYDGECSNIVITKVKNIYEEVENTAKTILDLIRKEGIRYRDISVISRDANEYNEIIDEIFQKYNIPVFIDNRESVENFSIFKLIDFALSAVCKGFDSESIISLIKTGIVDIKVEDAEIFELYVNVYKIDKSDFSEEFKLPVKAFLSGDEEYLDNAQNRIEQVRKTVITPLLNFKKRKGKTAGSIISGIYDLIKDYECPKNLKKSADEFLKKGYTRLSESTVRSYDILIHILDQLYLSVGNKEMQLKRFSEVFKSAVALLDIGSLPQGLDAAAAGSAERMRPKSPRVTFVLGANEGVFPSAKSGSGLFSDSELAKLKEKDINLPFYDIDTAVDEQYLAYLAVCSPSEKLYVSFCEGSIGGESKEPSEIVENILSIFPKLEVGVYNPSEIKSIDDALRAYALSKTNDLEAEKYFSENPDRRFLAVQTAAKDRFGKISRECTKELYGKNLYTSASRVETYNKCSFYYFCKYGIKANPIRQAKIDNLSRGSLVHFVLEKMVNLYSVDKFFSVPTEEIKEEILRLSNEFLKTKITEKEQTAVEKYRFSKLTDMIFELVLRVFDELKHSGFSVEATEFSIGNENPDIPAYEIEFEGSKIVLSGFIDRIDKAEKNEKKILRIIDYKTGMKNLRLYDIYYGQNLQMPLYMNAVVKNDKYKDFLPGGMFYFNANDAVVNAEKTTDAAEIEKERLKALKPDGLFLAEDEVIDSIDPDRNSSFSPIKFNKNGSVSSLSKYYTREQFEILSDYIDLKLKQTAKAVADGVIDVNPTDLAGSTACKYCDYQTVCNFKGEHRKLKSLKDTEVFELMLDELNKAKESEIQ